MKKLKKIALTPEIAAQMIESRELIESACLENSKMGRLIYLLDKESKLSAADQFINEITCSMAKLDAYQRRIKAIQSNLYSKLKKNN